MLIYITAGVEITAQVTMQNPNLQHIDANMLQVHCSHDVIYCAVQLAIFM